MPVIFYDHHGIGITYSPTSDSIVLYGDDPSWFHCWMLPYESEKPNASIFQPFYLFDSTIMYFQVDESLRLL